MAIEAARNWYQPKTYNKVYPEVNSNYNIAQNNYRLQKKAFIKSVEESSNKSMKDFLENLNNAVYGEVASTVEDELYTAIDNVKSEGANFIQSCMLGDNLEAQNALNELLTAFQKKIKTGKNKKNSLSEYTEEDIRLLYKRLIDNINKFLQASSFNKDTDLLNSLKSSVLVNGNQTNMTSIKNSFYGYFKRVVFKELYDIMAVEQQANEIQDSFFGTSGYVQSLSGYYRERFSVDLGTPVIKQWGLKFIPTGEISNKDNKEISTDALISCYSTGSSQIDSLLTSLKDSTTTSSKTMSLPETAGIQIKSWIEPWASSDKKGNRNFLKIGDRSSLLASYMGGQTLTSWHKGILLASRHMQQLLGSQNILMETGNSIYWTDEFISNFRQQQYYLAFYIKKDLSHEATGEVVWEKEASAEMTKKRANRNAILRQKSKI